MIVKTIYLESVKQDGYNKEGLHLDREKYTGEEDTIDSALLLSHCAQGFISTDVVTGSEFVGMEKYKYIKKILIMHNVEEIYLNGELDYRLKEDPPKENADLIEL